MSKESGPYFAFWPMTSWAKLYDSAQVGAPMGNGLTFIGLFDDIQGVELCHEQSSKKWSWII